MKVEDLRDFCDGRIITKLLSLVTGEKVGKLSSRRSETLTFQSIYRRETVTVALNFMIEHKMISKNQQIGPDDIVDGNSKMILATVWAIIRYEEGLTDPSKRLHTQPSEEDGETEQILKKPLSISSPNLLVKHKSVDSMESGSAMSSKNSKEPPIIGQSNSGNSVSQPADPRPRRNSIGPSASAPVDAEGSELKKHKKEKKEKHERKEKRSKHGEGGEKRHKKEKKEKKEKREKKECEVNAEAKTTGNEANQSSSEPKPEGATVSTLVPGDESVTLEKKEKKHKKKHKRNPDGTLRERKHHHHRYHLND